CPPRTSWSQTVSVTSPREARSVLTSLASPGVVSPPPPPLPGAQAASSAAAVARAAPAARDRRVVIEVLLPGWAGPGASACRDQRRRSGRLSPRRGARGG